MSLFDHLERALGTIQGGHAEGPGELQVVWFSSAVATLGLSRHRLAVGDGCTFRQELVMLFREGEIPPNAAPVVFDLAMEAITHDRAFLRGEVIGPRGVLFDGSRYEALYVAAPVYLPDEFHVYDPTGRDPTVITWLVPITRGEAHLVERRGWRFFESVLVEQDPDLCAPDREGVDLRLSY